MTQGNDHLCISTPICNIDNTPVSAVQGDSGVNPPKNNKADAIKPELSSVSHSLHFSNQAAKVICSESSSCHKIDCYCTSSITDEKLVNKTEVVDVLVSNARSHIASDSNIPPPASQDSYLSTVEIRPPPSDNTGAFQNKEVSDRTLIIDNIINPAEFTSSQRILKEIHNYFPEVEIEFAYSLDKGGVAVHTTSAEDTDLLLNNLPPEAFGSGVRHRPKRDSNKSVYLKGVDTSVDLAKVKEWLKANNIDICNIRRLTRRFTGKPTQVVKLRCSEESVNKLLNFSVVINNKVCKVERDRLARVIRCYNCQQLGHIAAHCQNPKVCEFCACSHSDEVRCTGHIKCANCAGPHPASSSQCNAYITRFEALADQHSKCQHFSVTALSHSGEATL